MQLVSGIRNSLAFRWGVKSSFAVTEQATVAGANFLFNVSLARWGATDEYGGFAIVQSVFFILALVHTAAFTEPMMVFAHRTFAQRRKSFYVMLLSLQLVFFAAAFIVFAVVGAILEAEGARQVGDSLLGFAFAAPALLAFNFLRRICYCESRPGHAAMAALIYLAATLGGIFVLVTLNSLTSLHLLFVITGCAVISVIYLFRDIRSIRDVAETDADMVSRKKIVELHWQYARWSLAGGFASWFPNNIGSIVLPIWADLNSVGMFRAMMNLIQPAYHVSVAVGGLAMPALSRHYAGPKFERYSIYIVAGLSSVGVFYSVFLLIWGQELANVVYNGRYGGHFELMIALAASCLFFPLLSAANAILRAKARPDWIFYSALAGAVFAIGAGIVGTMHFGVVGATYAMLIAYGVNAVVAYSGIATLYLDAKKAATR